MKITSIFKRPILTEKSLRLARDGWYTFEVNRKATKRDIASAAEKLFNVDVLSVRTITMRGKTRRTGRIRKEINKTDWKKAIIKIKGDQRIELFDIG